MGLFFHFQFSGKSFREGEPGQYVYDPMFCANDGDDEENEDYISDISELPFLSYQSVQKTPNKPTGKNTIYTPDDKKKSKSSSQNKTPRTMMRMMERHRENERVRHHTLNKSMKKVCDKVPGSSPFMKETKVVMMQRIIAYICFLENTISSVCTHLGIKQLRMSTNFITEQWKEPSRRKDEAIVIRRKSSPKSHRKLEVEKRRLKVSSPTIDSTTDTLSHTVTQEMLMANSQDSQGVSSTYQTNENMFVDENACCVPEYYEESYMNEDFLPSTSKLDNFPDAFDLMSSPVGNLPNHHTIDSSDECGIKEDRTEFDLLESPLRTISPESVLPTTLSQSSVTSPVRPRNKRKANLSLRMPFEDITNTAQTKHGNDQRWISKFSKECPVDENYVSYEPYIYKFHKSAASRRRRPDTENDHQQSMLVSSSEASDLKTSKIDHRKTTWMNGFMMFSRLNRRSFIEANPGVHTSHISKMMGHAWRQMTSDDQDPYREKARDFAQSMKSLACDESDEED